MSPPKNTGTNPTPKQHQNMYLNICSVQTTTAQPLFFHSTKSVSGSPHVVNGVLGFGYPFVKDNHALLLSHPFVKDNYHVPFVKILLPIAVKYLLSRY